MKKNNISTIGFIIISIITVVFIVYYSESTVQTAISINENNKLIVQKPDVIIEYYNQDNDFIVDGEKIIYISLDILSEHLNTRTSFDSEDNIAIITTLDKVIRFYGETDRVKVNGMEVDYISPMIMYDKKPLIPVSQIEESLKIESNIIENSNNIIIRSLLDNERIGETDRSIVTLKRDKSPWSEVIGVLSRGDKIQIISEDNEWMKILTDGGMEGFVKKGTIGKIEKIMGLEDEKNTSIWKPEKDRISLTWEHVHSRNPDTKKIKEMEGVNVISPTWIKLSSPSGGLKSNISKNYIDWAKGRGYKIWVLFSNSFDPDLTDKFLNNSIARERVINDLLEMIKDNDIDGINIDFENVYVKNKELLVQFVREMTPVFHENGLVVSIDVTVKGGGDNWSKFLDRKALGEVVDYMAVMTYDEHWRSSPISGSVASIGWVERGIKGILEEVPAEKLLLGVPFYTRLWIETPSQKEPNKMDVRSKAISMETAMDILRRNNGIKIWDEEAGQYYTAYIADNKLYKIWFEDSRSIKLKTDLVKKYNLAGVASWRRGFETEDIWPTINNNIN